jgi:hypothetical protein
MIQKKEWTLKGFVQDFSGNRLGYETVVGVEGYVPAMLLWIETSSQP